LSRGDDRTGRALINKKRRVSEGAVLERSSKRNARV